MAKSKAGTANLFAGMQKVMDKEEIKQKKLDAEKANKKENIIESSIPEEPIKKEIIDGNIDEISEDIQKPISELNKKQVTKTQPKKTKKKMGRPVIREGEYVRFAIDLPEELANQVNTAKLAYNNSLRTYVTKLIQKDLEANMDMYEKFKAMTNDVMNN